MKSWWLEIYLKSDLCSASGDSAAGLINIKTAQEYGLPVIPGKRIKGCLLNEAKEMAANGFLEAKVLENVFGGVGSGASGSLRVGDAHLYKVPDSILKENNEISRYDQLVDELRNHQTLRESQVEEMLTITRTRNAIDEETGAAQDTMLRTMQLVPRGTVFRSKLELIEDGKEAERLIEWCAKALRHMGMAITRGFGEVECKLTEHEEQPSAELESIDRKSPDGQAELFYEIKLNSPLLFAGDAGLYEDCSDQIPGSALLGAFAAMYIKNQGLGETAHQNKDFRRMFLEGGLQFGYGFLKRGERTYYPCAAAIAQRKDNQEDQEDSKKVCLNRLVRENETIRRKEIHSQVSLDLTERKLYLSEVDKEVRMHHARPLDRGIGHALNDRIKDTTAADMGQFFQYTCIAAKQTFAGSIKGDAADLQALIQCLETRKYHLSLGRSRSAEYGDCRFVPMALRESGEQEGKEQANKWALWLVTPMVLADEESGEIRPDLDNLEKQLTAQLIGAQILEEKAILKYTKIAGYNSKWRLPSPQYAALAPGSVIVIETEHAFTADELESLRFGEQTAKGFGQVMALPFNFTEDDMADITIEEAKEAVDKKTEHEFISQLSKCMECNKIMRKENMRAVTESSNVPLPNMAVISQLIRMVKNDEWNYDEIKKQADSIKDENKRKSVKKFLEPCKDESVDFIEMYLENSKWRKRMEAGHDIR